MKQTNGKDKGGVGVTKVFMLVRALRVYISYSLNS